MGLAARLNLFGYFGCSMGLKSAITNAVKSAFDSMADLQTTVYYTITQHGTYTASTGVIGDTTLEVPIKGFLVRYKQTEHDENDGLQPGDYKFIFQQSALADYAEYGIPKMSDTVVIENPYDFKQRTWDVVMAKQDPVNAIWVLGLRIGHPQEA